MEGGRVLPFHAGSFETKRPTRQERSALSFAFARVPIMRCDSRLDGGVWGTREGVSGEFGERQLRGLAGGRRIKKQHPTAVKDRRS